MTSPGRDAVLAYSGGAIDRAANQRADPGWIDATLAQAGTRLIPIWRDQCVVSGEPAVPAILPAAGPEADAVLNAAAEVVFLGLDDHGGIFAADLSPAAESRAVEAAGGERILDLRSLVGTVRVDGEEVIEARWFSRDELAGYAAARGRLGREDSIDRHLLRTWLEETG